MISDTEFRKDIIYMTGYIDCILKNNAHSHKLHKKYGKLRIKSMNGI